MSSVADRLRKAQAETEAARAAAEKAQEQRAEKKGPVVEAKKGEKKSFFGGMNLFGKPRTEEQREAARRKKEEADKKKEADKEARAKKRRERQEAKVRAREEKAKRKEKERAVKREANEAKQKEKRERKRREREQYELANATSTADDIGLITKSKGLFVTGNRSEIGVTGVAKNVAGSTLKLGGRSILTGGVGVVYSGVMWGAYSLGGPIGGAIVGAITGCASAIAANISHKNANKNEKWYKRWARGAGRIISMTLAGAAAGALPPPASFVAVGPAVVAADKLCSIGAHPKKTLGRHFGDLAGSLIPGAGLFQYNEKRNIELISGKAIQPQAAKVAPTPSPAPGQPVREHERDRGRGETAVLNDGREADPPTVPASVTSQPAISADRSGADLTKLVPPAPPPRYEDIYPEGPPAHIVERLTANPETAKSGAPAAPSSSPGAGRKAGQGQGRG